MHAVAAALVQTAQPAAQGRQTVPFWKKPVAHAATHAPCWRTEPAHAVHCVGAGPSQKRQVASHGWHTPLLLNAWKPHEAAHWPVSVTTRSPVHERHALEDADVHVAHGLLHGVHTPRPLLKRPAGHAATHAPW